MKDKFIKKIWDCSYEFEALEDGTIITSCGDHPTFGIKELEDMKIFIKKGTKFTISEKYLQKNG